MKLHPQKLPPINYLRISPKTSMKLTAASMTFEHLLTIIMPVFSGYRAATENAFF